MRARIDWAMPWRSDETTSGSKPRPTVSHVHRHGVSLHLGIEGGLGGAGPLGRVHRGLPGGVEQAPEPVVETAVADDDRLDADAVVGLDLGLDDSDALGQGGCLVTDGPR